MGRRLPIWWSYLVMIHRVIDGRCEVVLIQTGEQLICRCCFDFILHKGLEPFSHVQGWNGNVFGVISRESSVGRDVELVDHWGAGAQHTIVDNSNHVEVLLVLMGKWFGAGPPS